MIIGNVICFLLTLEPTTRSLSSLGLKWMHRLHDTVSAAERHCIGCYGYEYETFHNYTLRQGHPVLHVAELLVQIVQHYDVRVLLFETGWLVFPLIVTPLAKLLLHHIGLAALLLLCLLQIPPIG
uniref:Putative secreted protein n=1 Tax=Anopheles triannulatus TaxID=58253 RepID=A0A2M4B3F9_9DIPT